MRRPGRQQAGGSLRAARSDISGAAGHESEISPDISLVLPLRVVQASGEISLDRNHYDGASAAA